MTGREPAWAPPLRKGVNASQTCVGGGYYPSVLGFLAARFPAVADWPERIARGDVLGPLGEPLQAATPCPPGMRIWYWRSPPPERRIPFEIELLHQDEHLVVVDKPHFMAVTPGGRHLHETVLVRLRQELGMATLAPMHRLDRDTAGVLAFVVQPDTRHAYHALLRDRRVHKVYEAVGLWRADVSLPRVCRSRIEARDGPGFMQMQVAAGEPNAETHIELIRRIDAPPDAHAAAWAHYRLCPLTGRKHQLRVQMSALGLGIVGDRIYPQLLPEPARDAADDYSQPLQLLARALRFVDPISGRERSFVSRRRLQEAPPD